MRALTTPSKANGVRNHRLGLRQVKLGAMTARTAVRTSTNTSTVDDACSSHGGSAVGRQKAAERPHRPLSEPNAVSASLNNVEARHALEAAHVCGQQRETNGKTDPAMTTSRSPMGVSLSPCWSSEARLAATSVSG
jgi:hypothetical protein